MSTGYISALSIGLAWSSAIFSAGMLSAGMLACGGLHGDPELRPELLTPTSHQAVGQGMDPEPNTPDLPDVPPPTPVGVADENGYISGPPQECAGPEFGATGTFGTPAPSTGVLIDFTKYMPGGSWGVTADGDLTGGTSLYSLAPPTDSITPSVVGDELQLEAAIGAGGYAGIVLWFQPCVNASAFSGLQFTARGALGGATMIIKPQTSVDYPIDPVNKKGKCRFKADASKYTECQQPTVQLKALPAGPITQTWASFTGGLPLPLDPNQLLGFELQFSCPSTAPNCPLKLDLGSVGLLP